LTTFDAPLHRRPLRDHVDVLDRRRVEQLAGVLAERLRDLAGEVRLAAGFVREGVEDPEARGSEADPEPPRRRRLLLDERTEGR
jgi:hypothetical protein